MLLIDGYNVLFARGIVRDVPKARKRLLRQIESYCARTGQRARVYFDCREGPLRGRLPHVEIYYVAAGETADHAIGRAVSQTADRTAYHVVSSDREVADMAKKRHMAVTPSEDFLKMLGPQAEGAAEPPAKREGVSDAEAKYWMREFGLEGNSDEAR